MTAYIACDQTDFYGTREPYWHPTMLTDSPVKARRWANACLDSAGKQTHETCVIEYTSWDAAIADYLKGRISLADMAGKMQVAL